MRRVIVLLILAACVEPVTPGSVVTTLDDPGDGAFTAVAVGRLHTCALTGDGAAWCWGSNEQGQLGLPDDGTHCDVEDRTIPCQVVPRPVAGGLQFSAIAAGQAHTCAITTSGAAWCWGDGEFGQLGAAVRRSDEPVPVETTSRFADITAGVSHTCGVRTDGVAMCWGANNVSQLGRGVAVAGSAVPITVSTNQRFVRLRAGEHRTCGIATNGEVSCWGRIWLSRSSDGRDLYRIAQAPSQFDDPLAAQLTFTDLDVGGSSCGLLHDGAAACWESNASGGLGIDALLPGSTDPRFVVGDHRFIAIAAGRSHACGIDDSGRAYCWGAGGTGQLGVSPTRLDRRCPNGSVCALQPVQVHGWRQFTGISAGLGDHMCGVTWRGNVFCWGAGSAGQLGTGRRSFGEWSPARITIP